jgi:hypothetical protein
MLLICRFKFNFWIQFISMNEHWNKVYQTKSDEELGWYEKDGSQTLTFLSDLDLTNRRILLTGAGTSNLIGDLLNITSHLYINDISEVSLQKVIERYVFKLTQNQLIADDLGAPSNVEYPLVDLWIDRAVLHFLLEEHQIQNYLHKLNTSLVQGGYVMFAEFEEGGAEKCSGLPIQQYTLSAFETLLGHDYQLVKMERFTFLNPAQQERPYIYVLFKKVN